MSDLPPADAALQPSGSGPSHAGLEANNAGPRAPGAWLAAARREHGLTVEQVASQLNLAPRQVAALEADDYAALPGMVIVRGFLRAYAKLLKVDPAPLLALLADPSPAISTAPARQMAPSSFSQSRMPAMHGGAERSSKAPLVAVLAVVAVAAGASYALGWWPDALTRRFGQLRGAVLAGVGAAPQAGTVDANDAARAADVGSATGSVTGAGAAANADGNAPPQAVDAGKPANAAEPALTTTTTLSNPVAAPATGVTPAAATAAATAGATAAAPAAVMSAPAPVPTAAPSATTPSVTPAAGKPGVKPTAAADATAANPLVLHVQQDSWIEIKRADKSAIVSRLVKAGSIETFDIDQPVTLIVGNIAGVEASLRGAPLSLDAGAKGNVAKLRIE